MCYSFRNEQTGHTDRPVCFFLCDPLLSIAADFVFLGLVDVPEWLLSIVVSFVIGAGVVRYLLMRINHLERLIQQLRDERDELITGRERSTMYAKALTESNERREQDLAELRTAHHATKEELWRTKESYERFVATMRVAVKNGDCAIDIDRIKSECELTVYAQQYAMQMQK